MTSKLHGKRFGTRLVLKNASEPVMHSVEARKEQVVGSGLSKKADLSIDALSSRLTRTIDELGQLADHSMGIGAPSRSTQDAAFYVAMRQLKKPGASANSMYAELVCARLVEKLRTIRDLYRGELARERRIPRELAYWFVFRFAVMDWAVKLLRAEIRSYIWSAGIPSRDWLALFGSPLFEMDDLEQSETRLGNVAEVEAMEAVIVLRIRKGCFDEMRVGGPFGREEQWSIALEFAPADPNQGLTLPDVVRERQKLWDAYASWIEPIASMFDVVQEELMFQSSALPDESRRKEEIFPRLSLLEQIVYKHLVGIRISGVRLKIGREGWLALVKELDENKVPFAEELPSTAQELLSLIRKRGNKVDTWTGGYLSKAASSLEKDTKARYLRNEVKTFLHNVAKRVAHLVAAQAIAVCK